MGIIRASGALQETRLWAAQVFANTLRLHAATEEAAAGTFRFIESDMALMVCDPCAALVRLQIADCMQVSALQALLRMLHIASLLTIGSLRACTQGHVFRNVSLVAPCQPEDTCTY